MGERKPSKIGAAEMARIDAALDDLAALYPYGALQLATDPAALIAKAVAEIRATRRILDTSSEVKP